MVIKEMNKNNNKRAKIPRNSKRENFGKLMKNKYINIGNEIMVKAFKAGPNADSIPMNENANIRLNAKKNNFV